MPSEEDGVVSPAVASEVAGAARDQAPGLVSTVSSKTSTKIHDSTGIVQHRETFTYSLDGGALSDFCMASAQLVKGGFTTGLLVSVGCLPSAPGSGDVWELFGLRNGKLIRFGKPFTTNGELLDLVPTPAQKMGPATMFLPALVRCSHRGGARAERSGADVRPPVPRGE